MERVRETLFSYRCSESSHSTARARAAAMEGSRRRAVPEQSGHCRGEVTLGRSSSGWAVTSHGSQDAGSCRPGPGRPPAGRAEGTARRFTHMPMRVRRCTNPNRAQHRLLLRTRRQSDRRPIQVGDWVRLILVNVAAPPHTLNARPLPQVAVGYRGSHVISFPLRKTLIYEPRPWISQ